MATEHGDGDTTIPNKNYGLSTRAALRLLQEEIDQMLQEYEKKFKEESFYKKLRSAFVKRYESPLGWLAIATSAFTMTILLITDAYMAGICLAAILLLDLFVVVRENNLRLTEIYRKTRQQALADLQLAEEEFCADWQPMNYPHLWCPVSPCVSLQWTYRDGVIVNLPYALLVRGDHIVLRPGHITPGPCTEVGGKKIFNIHEIYGVAQISGEPPAKPMARPPLPNLVCCLQNTPFLNNLRTILDTNCRRPSTIYNQQRYLLVSKYIQQWGFMCALCVTLLAGVLRMHGIGFATHTNAHDEQHYWKHVLIESTAAAVIPLLPLVFPIMWICMNLWGVARLQCFLRTPQILIAKDTAKSFEEDLDTPTFDYEHVVLMRANVLRNWLQLWKGDSDLLPRSANVVQVLGSITALCCVDKKGILSWPNPTAEKIFFLHDAEEQLDERCNSESTINTESDLPHANNKESGIVAEVLDLTHDQHCPFKLEFDDHAWKNHIKSLKPLGLAILLNTCSPLTHAHYAQFCGHVTAVAMLDKDLVPVTNRYAIVESSMNSFMHGRCLCELAKQIGFTDHATDRFTLEGQLASYRHLQPEVVRRDIRFARQLQLSTKVKVPFPHSLSVVMRENPGGYLSLFTQGTADIILDFCDDFWDGKDLRPLSQQDRKRALDFYQRSALTAYCTAFAYRPLRHSIHGALSGTQQQQRQRQGDAPIAYLELPPESKIRMQHVDKVHCDYESGGHHAKLSHSISTDSLLFSEHKEDVSDVDSCFEMQCHQVFIGMVTMQYQAQTDVVQLVERLDRACIRFVHFSKENELRSRVFSEKMGLESGWNCHISLLSEADERAPPGGSAAGAASLQSPKHSTGKVDNSRINTTASTNIQITASSTHAKNTALISSSPHNSAILSHINQNIPPSLPNANIPAIAPNIPGGGGPSADGGPEADLNCLLPPAANLEFSKLLSSSAPGAISNQDYNMLNISSSSDSLQRGTELAEASSNQSLAGSQQSLRLSERTPDQHIAAKLPSLGGANMRSSRRHSQDSSAMDENCRSLSILTESTESAPAVHFDMSNRAKLPRGIENIRPHLELVDNVPLQVSLFTDCSAEATREMIDIMQTYGEIVCSLGSSASNSNAEIFLQGDCSIAVEPLYPQVCQDVPAYTEANIFNNRLRLSKARQGAVEPTLKDELLEEGLYDLNGGIGAFYGGTRPMQSQGNTVSPIYLSRLLNALPCSISVCRDDPLSLVAIIELSRRFSSGLWNCIQYWACCAAALSAINMLSACLSLPPLVPPFPVLYLMCVPVPLISLALAHIDADRAIIMNRATGKKQTEYDSRVFGFVIWCYGCKFLTPILIIILSYCAFMTEGEAAKPQLNLHLARVFALPGILLHFVVVSASFVHRDHSIWQRSPFRNHVWCFTCLCILVLHGVVGFLQLALNEQTTVGETHAVWRAIVLLYSGIVVSFIVTEITKWQEIKVNTRYQRRARLDFGTKLGMNSPF